MATLLSMCLVAGSSAEENGPGPLRSALVGAILLVAQTTYGGTNWQLTAAAADDDGWLGSAPRIMRDDDDTSAALALRERCDCCEAFRDVCAC